MTRGGIVLCLFAVVVGLGLSGPVSWAADFSEIRDLQGILFEGAGDVIEETAEEVEEASEEAGEGTEEAKETEEEAEEAVEEESY